MNPDGDDLSISEGCRRALTRALFDCVNEAAAECLAQMEREQAATEQAAARVPRPIRRRTFVPREHDVSHQRLFANCFAEQPRWGPTGFHRRFRMQRDLFLSIVRTLEGRDEYLQYQEDGIGRPGLTPLQKCTVAIRLLAYGTTADMFDEYLHVGETTGRSCLKNFCKGVVEAFGDTYLRRPTADDCQRLMRMHEMVHGFPGMLGSIDWVAAWPRVHCQRPQISHGYYLADDIYPRWPVFVKTISCPIGDRRVLFAAKQEFGWKDVERAFGVLQSRWAIVKGPVCFWFKEVIVDVMYVCIIMHDMIVEQEIGHVTNWVDDETGSSSSTATPPVARGLPLGFGKVLERQTSMRSQQDHTTLMGDMIEEVWKCFGH
ncbi:uncharacterized protein LOC125206561 [Salvia hispanica]|uniref:uncharacterized protein LOC125206561 n=1 Tax=Salvia hispanica TaxID=49212 RepID=UPI002009642E|nr:uncharacterized protein LOC125206561 [Salvia hispanica]